MVAFTRLELVILLLVVTVLVLVTLVVLVLALVEVTEIIKAQKLLIDDLRTILKGNVQEDYYINEEAMVLKILMAFVTNNVADQNFLLEQLISQQILLELKLVV